MHTPVRRHNGLLSMTKRYPRGSEPAEVFHTRLSASEEAPLLKEHAKTLNISLSAALRDIARRGMNLPSLFANSDS